MRIRVAKNADNQEIINQISQAMPLAMAQTREAAKKFQADTVENTARRIYKYLRQDIKYKADKGTQRIKLPRALIRERSGDCKSYALFSMAVCKNLGLDCAFRYTGYDKTSKIPSHVYTVVFDGKNEIPIDGVLPIFGEDKGHFINDIKIDSMQVETITGRKPGKFPGTQKEWEILTLTPNGRHKAKVLNAQIAVLDKYGLTSHNGINGKFWKKLKKTVIKIGTKISDTAKKAVKVLSKINPIFVTGRLAFLGLLKANFQGMAKKMSIVWGTKPNEKKKIIKKWEAMGGNVSALEAAFNKGKSKGMNGHEYVDEWEEIVIDGINGEENFMTKLIAQAAPIIETIAPFLKFINLKGAPKTEDTISDVVKIALAQSKETFDKTVDLLKRSEDTTESPAGTIIMRQEDLKALNSDKGGQDDSGGNDSGGNDSGKVGILIALAALGFVMMNKK
jgi:hypothetical protein